MNPTEECPHTPDGKHVFEELEDGSIICFECDFVLERGHQPKKKDRHETKKIPT